MADSNGSGLDLVRAVAEHADVEASELQAQAATLRANASELEARATVLLQLHRIARPHIGERRPTTQGVSV